MSRQTPSPELEPLAARLLEGLGEGSPDLREAALLAADGTQVASTDGADWSAGAAELWQAAECAGQTAGGDDAGPDQIHVATAEGEVFAIRDGAAAVVATSERFALASLMLCDLRAVLRGFQQGGG